MSKINALHHVLVNVSLNSHQTDDTETDVGLLPAEGQYTEEWINVKQRSLISDYESPTWPVTRRHA